ncbi:uncharacterized protein Z520_11041 [Fonsecaea multimorphosa CBS 102226]|uniref:DUF6590 domain-containing protein n=1 Tax=Fonsecaea multimorphosa CBS 102226 TaxID=1442371 RepID=A0A0D2JJ16_9EURO|nr:uncharacterized protein Z520_11041 [Fonsecaea multimorphosa CBS 102226]KIX93187.1 hypothetical protein Z520_11041 [Fonsecaea multimorphosa CBS 102226]OAL18425.1 hypothetical protein AYO22_10621 [Fonsecaea multimorphosa]
MSSPQDRRRKPRRSRGKDDGANETAAAVGLESPREIEVKEPETPSRTEGRAKDKATAHGRSGVRNSPGDDHEESAVLSERTTSATSPLANKVKEGKGVSFPHVDDEDLWRAIFDWTFQPRSDSRVLADEVYRNLSTTQDYQFLLEAMRCDRLREPRLRDTYMRLYLLARSYGPASPSSDVEESRNRFDGLSEEYLNHTGVEFDQLAGQLRQMTMLQKVGEEEDEGAMSVSQTSYPFHQIQSSAKGKSKIARPQSSYEATQNRLPSQASNDRMEPGYRIRESKWFSFGRVFKMLWHDNATGFKVHANTTSIKQPGDDTGHITQGPLGQTIYSQIRRFAVVKKGHGFSWAIPINTYHEKGTTRKSFDKHDRQAHAIIYLEGTKPESLPEEGELRKEPIEVVGASGDNKLHKASRIRFDKVFTIEHNVLVKNVGRISKDSMPYFSSYWREQALADLDGHDGPSAQLKTL